MLNKLFSKSPKKRNIDLLTAEKKIITHSWFHENRKLEYVISFLPFFFLQEWVHTLISTVWNPKEERHEWIPYNYYSQHQLLYQCVWFCIWFVLLWVVVLLFNVSSLTHVGMFTGLQFFFGNERDRCVTTGSEEALLIYLSPEQLIDRKSFYSLRSVSESDKNAGFLRDVYYAPMDSSVMITFQTLMTHMGGWIQKMKFTDRCVCFYHFGVGIKGGFVQGQFFIDPEITKATTNTITLKIGGISYTVPAVSVMKTLVPSSCKPIEIRIEETTNACISHCSR